MVVVKEPEIDAPADGLGRGQGQGTRWMCHVNVHGMKRRGVELI